MNRNESWAARLRGLVAWCRRITVLPSRLKTWLPTRLPAGTVLRSFAGRTRDTLTRLRVPGGWRLWITLVSVGFLLAALFHHGRQLLALRPDGQGWLWLVLGLGVAVLSLVVSGLAWGVILRWLGQRPRWAATVSLHVATNLRKYLPGGIWHLASRVQALRKGSDVLPAPTGTGTALVAVLLDPVISAAAALALVAAGGWQNGLGPLALLPLVLLLPRWLQPILRRLETKRAAELGLAADLSGEGEGGAADPILRGYPWAALLAELLFVALRFAAFACCVLAFDLQQVVGAPTWLAGFALAWTAGLVVPGAPGGLGVFEAVLLVRLSVVVPEPSLLAVALSYRLLTTLADLLAAGLVSLDARLAAALTARTARTADGSQ
jgi:uncharacterized membrane protein YbhN (UPF0104 family)